MTSEKLEIISYMKNRKQVQIIRREVKSIMQGNDIRWGREVEGMGQRFEMVKEDEEFADLNKELSKWMFWAAGLSIIFLLAHYLRWIVNG
ncbi:MAG: hypothetical protein GX825_06650 [Syntrophomonadaceae bacterium]|nr:hypothetical protein [Syntrophomonadaceae bacterium]